MNEIFERIVTPFTCLDSKNKIEKLNDTFTVYRGLRDNPADLDNCGFCWTLDEKIAIKFATADEQTTGFVVNGETNKSLIKGYVTWRDEKEIIVTARDVS